MRYLMILFAASALISCKKDKRYTCNCLDKEDNKVHRSILYAPSFQDGEPRCHITEDSLKKTNLFNGPYCKFGSGEI